MRTGREKGGEIQSSADDLTTTAASVGLLVLLSVKHGLLVISRVLLLLAELLATGELW